MKYFIKKKIAVVMLAGISSVAWGFGTEGLQQQGASAEELSLLADQYIGHQEAIDMGRQLYGNTCLFCHGPNGVGARAPSLVAGAYRPGGGNTPEYMYSVVINGVAGTIMGSFRESHTDEQIWQILAFLRDQSAKLAEKK